MPPESNIGSWVFPIGILGTDVYAGGYYVKSGMLYVAGYWKNGMWNGLTPLDPAKSSMVTSIEISEG